MDIKTKLEAINTEIQSFKLDDSNDSNNGLVDKLEELKSEMVEAYEHHKDLNKYMVRLPMWLIDMNLMDYKRHLHDTDKEVKKTLVNNVKQIANKAIELFEKAFTEKRAGMAVH